MTRFRKKPVVIEAVRWNGHYDRMLFPMWFNSAMREYSIMNVGEVMIVGDALNIFTLEGVMRANIGDWIICGVKGELYPCKPDIFAATYEAVDSQNDAALDEEMEEWKRLDDKFPDWSVAEKAYLKGMYHKHLMKLRTVEGST